MKQVPRYDAEEVHHALDENLRAYDDAKAAIVHALTKVPSRVVDSLASKCLIIVPSVVGLRGIHIPHKVLLGNEVIAFAERVFDLPDDETERLILHQVAHFWLKHKSAALEGISKGEVEQQEKEADELAARWKNEAKG